MVSYVPARTRATHNHLADDPVFWLIESMTFNMALIALIVHRPVPDCLEVLEAVGYT